MKRLTCEMCGSTDLMKENGVFVCQTCGCKYSVEEAKKMMVEGVVQVEGTVKIDNSGMTKTYKDMAIKAYDSGNTKEAYQYFLKVLEIEPKDYQCIFYKGMCQGWETTLARPRVGEAVAAYQQAIQYAPVEIAQNVKELFITELTRLMSAWLEKAEQRYLDVDDFYMSNRDIFYDYMGVGEKVVKYIDSYMDAVVNSESAAFIEAVGELYCSACEAVCSYAQIWTNYSQENLIYSGLSSKEKAPFLRDYDNMIFEVRKHNPAFKRPTSEFSVIRRLDAKAFDSLESSKINYQKCLDADKAINQRVQRYKDEVVQKRNRERREKYWSEHIAEKQQYESRLTAIESEIKALRKQDTPFAARIAEIKKDLSQPIPAESQLIQLKKQQNELMSQKSKLGLFAGKQKKALQAQIDSLQAQIDNTNATVQRMKKEIQADVSARISAVEAERKPITDRICVLEKEINDIHFELTKER